jgi:chromosomal replication initiation ATPase DnaA
MRPEDIISLVGASFGIEPSVLCGNRRTQEISDARHMAAALLRNEGLSSIEIGKKLGNRDHSTILYGLRVHEQLIISDCKYRMKYVANKAAVETEEEIPQIQFESDEERVKKKVIFYFVKQTAPL